MAKLFQCPFCEQDTAGNHEPHCPNNPAGAENPFLHMPASPLPIWICPFCNTVYPYWVSECTCSKVTNSE